MSVRLLPEAIILLLLECTTLNLTFMKKLIEGLTQFCARRVYHLSSFPKSNNTFKKHLKLPKGIIRSRKSKKGILYNGQKKRTEKKNNDLQNTTQKTK